MKITFNHRKSFNQGFTLVEMLTVVSIMIVLSAMSALTLPSILSSQTISQASTDIAQTLDDARSYAVANHTYVFVGFEEVNASNMPNSANQAQATATTGGRIAVAIFASQDGTNNLSGTAPYFNSSNLIPISKLKYFSGVHLADLTGLSTSSGPMAARAPVAAANSLGHNSTGGTTSLFTWPLNAASGAVEYRFYPGQIIMFDQEGLAGVVNTNTYASTGYTAPTSTWIEIGLQLAHGAMIPANPTTPVGQIASIQIDGVTGGNRILRP